MVAVEFQRLTIAPLGVFRTRRVVMQLPQMPNRVRQQERVAHVTANGDRLLVQLQRLVVAPEVSLDIAERPERLNRLVAFVAILHGTLFPGPQWRHTGSSVSIGTPAELPHSVQDPS